MAELAALGFLYVFILGLGFYFFSCLVIHKICEKFGIGSLFECCIPIYQLVLLCRCADISGWNCLWYILPSFFIFVIGPLANIPGLILSVVIWGRIAERLGRGYWSYGLGGVFLLGIPILVLAFSEVKPQVRVTSPNEVLSEQIYRPLSAPTGTRHGIRDISSNFELFCHAGDLSGNAIPLPRNGLTIGRDKSLCQIVVMSNEASRAHAKVMPNPRGVSVTDLNSTNGTYLLVGRDWKKLEGEVVLTQGQRFKVGKGAVAEFEVRSV